MGDILMLKGTPSPWSSGVLENPDIDALPYIDHDYANPKVKAEVDKLIEEEMRCSSKRPADFLAQLPPVPKFDFTVCLLLLLVFFCAFLVTLTANQFLPVIYSHSFHLGK